MVLRKQIKKGKVKTGDVFALYVLSNNCLSLHDIMLSDSTSLSVGPNAQFINILKHRLLPYS